MMYSSTRNFKEKVTAAEAIARGIAPDGGLYVPDSMPEFSTDRIRELGALDYRGRALAVMKPFLDEFSEAELRDIIEKSYGDNFDATVPAPLHFTDGSTAVLELWHGPTCAFKDMALQMLPHLLTASLKKCGEERRVCILVATSGDTGKAALEGFADVENTRILVFFPHNGVSDVQQLQMITQSGDNVGVAAVRGNFDDAQTGVKRIFADEELSRELSERGWFLSSANSINWGRLLPQIVYYFSAYCDYAASGAIAYGDKLDFCVPTGNFGNILACYYAKRMGLPVGRLICASNRNNVLTDFIRTGVYDKNRTFYSTPSPSMDILVSSNLERLLSQICGSDKLVADYMSQLAENGKYEVSAEIKQSIQDVFIGGCCSDEETRAQIAKIYGSFGYLIDTHTAVAYKVLDDYRAGNEIRPCVVVSTASPFKFCDSVLSAIGRKADASGTELIEKLSEATGLPVPSPLKGLDKRERRFERVVSKNEMRLTVADFLK